MGGVAPPSPVENERSLRYYSLILPEASEPSALMTRHGRRTGLKIRSSQKGVGSSPTFGSIDLRRICRYDFPCRGNNLATGLRSHWGDPMAGLQNRSGRHRIFFRYDDKQRTLLLGKVSRDEAEAKSAPLDYLLMRLKPRPIKRP
jgi:hypothetical protein